MHSYASLLLHVDLVLDRRLFDVSDNRLSGTLPSQLGGMTNTQYVLLAVVRSKTCAEHCIVIHSLPPLAESCSCPSTVSVAHYRQKSPTFSTCSAYSVHRTAAHLLL